MQTEKFLKQLKKELPLWVEKGWVDDENLEALAVMETFTTFNKFLNALEVAMDF